MNAVEIEEAVSELAAAPFDRAEFPFRFLAAFGNKETTLKRLRAGATNVSDVPGAVLQRGNIHLLACAPGAVEAGIEALRASPKTASAKAKFILATDGDTLQAEDTTSGDAIAVPFADLPDKFGFFLPLAGITTVSQIKESAFDIRATSRLNRLYVELLKDNPDWAAAARRPDMNHFMARLIFCFFAEDTDIFNGKGLFTATIDQMSARDSSNTHEVIAAIFRAMNTRIADRAAASLPRWADAFPYVNGGLFSGSTEVPRFSKIARAYILSIGSLDWQKINPDIFGSMIQAVADDEERGSLGMHYTSVPNILKVLNPLFLDDLREKLAEAGDNPRKLLNLRGRMARIRVFDPACGSGNFLVIAYKEMRAIEAEINQRRGEPERRSDIRLTNFRGIELRDFPAEIARLALIIAEYQCDVLYRGQKEAMAEFLPLDSQNWVTCGNALRLDWLSICPPTGTAVKVQGDDLFSTPLDQAEIDFENEGGETYLCGNPPYLGSTWQTPEQKADLQAIFDHRTKSWKSLDYVAGWFMKAADYGTHTSALAAFVSTNSICQGQQVPVLWPLVFMLGQEIRFAHSSFVWSNLASHNAGVIVVIVGVGKKTNDSKFLFSAAGDGAVVQKAATQISPYLVPAESVFVSARSKPLSHLPLMQKGNQPTDGGGLALTSEERHALLRSITETDLIRPYLGSKEFIRGEQRFCLWLDGEAYERLKDAVPMQDRFAAVTEMRASSPKAATRALANKPYRFDEIRQTITDPVIIVPSVSSENRDYLPVGYLPGGTVISNLAFFVESTEGWPLALIGARMHLVWVAAVCGKLKNDYRYSNTLGWNTFPVPKLTDQNKADLTRCAEDILLAREAHFPATIADLYDPETMPENLRRAHVANDETLERIYIGRRFKNDTERLEKLFEMYTAMTKERAA